MKIFGKNLVSTIQVSVGYTNTRSRLCKNHCHNPWNCLLPLQLGTDKDGEEYIQHFIQQRIPHHEARFGQYLNIEKTGRKKLRTPRKAANLRKKQVLSAADKKQLKLFDIPEDQQK